MISFHYISPVLRPCLYNLRGSFANPELNPIPRNRVQLVPANPELESCAEWTRICTAMLLPQKSINHVLDIEFSYAACQQAKVA